MILKLDATDWNRALRIAEMHASKYPKEERGLGIRNFVGYGQVSFVFIAYWTKTMLVVRQLEERTGTPI